jgi:hypothetical protein
MASDHELTPEIDGSNSRGTNVLVKSEPTQNTSFRRVNSHVVGSTIRTKLDIRSKIYLVFIVLVLVEYCPSTLKFEICNFAFSPFVQAFFEPSLHKLVGFLAFFVETSSLCIRCVLRRHEYEGARDPP